MNQGKRLGRFGVFVSSLVVLMMMAAVVSKAAVTFTTPNCVLAIFTLAPGATSAAVTPPTDTAVILSAVDITPANFSVGSVNLIHSQGQQLRWVGLESPPSATIVHGASATPGTHVVYLDFAHKVDVEVLSADTVVIHNGATTTESTKLKMIW